MKREPAWVTALTWSGSVLVVLGIGVMFYAPALSKKLRQQHQETEPLPETENLQPEATETQKLVANR